MSREIWPLALANLSPVVIERYIGWLTHQYQPLKNRYRQIKFQFGKFTEDASGANELAAAGVAAVRM